MRKQLIGVILICLLPGLLFGCLLGILAFSITGPAVDKSLERSIEQELMLETLVKWQICSEDENCWNCISQNPDIAFCFEHAYLGVRGITPDKWREVWDGRAR